MMNDIRTVLRRSGGALVGDTLGIVAIAVLLLVALHLPSGI